MSPILLHGHSNHNSAESKVLEKREKSHFVVLIAENHRISSRIFENNYNKTKIQYKLEPQKSTNIRDYIYKWNPNPNLISI